jgi:membrane-bound lytic murein transglycosylase F
LKRAVGAVRAVRAVGAVVLLVAVVSGLAAQGRSAPADHYDSYFRKYTKRFFGPAFDWRVFKAQGMAESRLDMAARSRTGARGIMQLMPSTFEAIQSKAPDLVSIDDPEWNIAAGIRHNRVLWRLWAEAATPVDQRQFMFASYNAGRSTILRAQSVARASKLDPRVWPSVEAVAIRVRRWRQRETLRYLRTIEMWLGLLDENGRLAGRRR